ncbi:sensor histidine kinase [Longimicrobium sp.]|uniref:sensor histidine kinase n=1 Tax=Longimicrobium sp. TaxID=2029185 RepID=UPI003B3B936F
MRRIDWRAVRRDLLLGFSAWSIINLFFYSRSYVSYVTQLRPEVTWEQIWLRALVETSFDILTWTLLTPIVLALARRFPLTRGSVRRSLPVHVAAALLVATADVLISYAVATQTYLYGPFWPRFYWISLHYAVLSYVAVAAAGHGMEIYRRFRERELQASQLETQLARAHLHALEMQIQPHFLFNTLNSISELIHAEPEAAELMVAQLGDLLRMTIAGDGRQEVPLSRELDLVGAYLEIERTRFQDRLTVKKQVDEDVTDALVPSLILQPLVENAIRHGLSPRVAPGTVTLTARRVGDRLRITVRDDGRGLPPPDQRRERVGVGNTRTRLMQAYGADHRFELADAPGRGTQVLIEIPWRPAGRAEVPEPRLASLAGASTHEDPHGGGG